MTFLLALLASQICFYLVPNLVSLIVDLAIRKTKLINKKITIGLSK